jgi:hypothetical protein
MPEGRWVICAVVGVSAIRVVIIRLDGLNDHLIGVVVDDNRPRCFWRRVIHPTDIGVQEASPRA